MIYNLIEPPFHIKPYEEMTLKEAKMHLEWYISLIPSRVDILKSAFEVSKGGEKENLDFSIDSLKTIWKWFIPLIKVEPKSKDDLEKERKTFPQWVSNTLKDTKLSVGTMAMLIDISLYFAEVFIQNNKGIQWGLAKSRSKNYINYNKPVLIGFKAGKYDDELDPKRIVHVLTSKVAFDGNNNPDALYDIYNVWKEKISS